MCIPPDMENIDRMRDLGEKVKVITTEENHEVLKNDLRFFIAGELGFPVFQNSGANTICGSTWKQLWDLLGKNSIIIPDEIIPCHTCDGSRCRDCDRHS